MTKPEMVAEIRELAAKLPPAFLPKGLTKLNKDELQHALDGLRTEVARRFKDESVNEAVDGGEVATRWLDLPADKQTETPEQMVARLAEVPSPMREYQSSQEALDVLEAGQDFALGDVPELEYDTTVDPEFAAEVDALVARDLAADLPPASVYQTSLPVTETDVEAANVDVVVQLKSRLYNGKLIAVVNRRTTFANPILATVEVGGVRFLVNADDMLAA
jgi:hypothetical protein